MQNTGRENVLRRLATATDRTSVIANLSIRLRSATPVGNNTVTKYRAVLELDAGNKAATTGLRGIVDRYLTLGKAAVERKDLAQAESYLRRALEIAPDNRQLQRDQRRLNEAIAKRSN